ncbi:carbohydrate ABC transporter permease [Kordiimonas sp. SCSIO 12603]|uniref:carbohydrate ABC transporter permease n=1 Tax=Kordiimonas sp. SCSIO 12603 TaxID=2829596 RepID=UPI002107FF6C|nr:carbohydrate ABC transporter permease [Kordiimonas sp. SCSIO 12603]UTW59517.1 carbohydrate ABC transporter permease [Kordiimonas sp. SCSIO 12603]
MKKISALSFGLLFALLSFLPYAWLIYNSFRDRKALTASPPEWGLNFTLDNFSWVYNGQNIVGLLGNSFLISTVTALVCLCVALPAAYYFARHRNNWSKHLFLLVLSTRMAPPVAISLPLFVIFSEVGIRGTYGAIILAEVVFNLAFVVWFLEAAISAFPQSIEKASLIDGNGRLQTLLAVVVPNIWPSVLVCFGFVFLFTWNEYLIASLISSSTTSPVTPALPSFVAQATSQWGRFSAVAFMASLPALALAVGARKYLANVFTSGLITKT